MADPHEEQRKQLAEKLKAALKDLVEATAEAGAVLKDPAVEKALRDLETEDK